MTLSVMTTVIQQKAGGENDRQTIAVGSVPRFQLQEDHWDPSTSLWQSERAVTVDWSD
jgi:hypothetical protein